MRLNAVPAEFSPLEDQEPARPELRLIKGDGEDVGLAPDSEHHVALYAVPDHEHSADEDADNELSAARQRAAKRAGRILRGVTSSEQPTSSRSQHHHHGGGGGWAIREFLRKEAAKDHESECGCHYCAA